MHPRQQQQQQQQQQQIEKGIPLNLEIEQHTWIL
jgi:hypothetical protein